MVRLLIMDYSTDKSETALMKQWLPPGTHVETCYVVESGIAASADGFSHILHTGSSLSIVEEAPFIDDAINLIHSAIERNLEQMGICYGHQLLCRAILGKDAVRRCPNGGEAGWLPVHFSLKGRTLFQCEPVCRIFQYHYDEVTEVPENSQIIAYNEATAIQAFWNSPMRLLGMQFHPEFDRNAGNREFACARSRLESEHVDVDEILNSGPKGFPTEKVFHRFLTGM
jgi:GMP synthase-like glutamine amidotransferase